MGILISFCLVPGYVRPRCGVESSADSTLSTVESRSDAEAVRGALAMLSSFGKSTSFKLVISEVETAGETKPPTRITGNIKL